MHLILFGLNHKTASLSIRNCMAFTREVLVKFSEEIKKIKSVQGSLVLSTCNRTEFYFCTDNYHTTTSQIKKLISAFSGYDYRDISQYIYAMKDEDVVNHLFTVSSGLDSMIVGESQILGQVQDAYTEALELKMTNSVLNKLFQHAIITGKLVRTNTLVDRNSVSVSTTAIDLANQKINDFSEIKVMILGAGKNNQLAVKYLLEQGVEDFIIANRTLEKAEKLADFVDGEAIELKDYPKYVKECSLVVSSTSSPDYIVRREDVEEEMRGKKDKTLFIDVAVPRDIDPEISELENVELIDLDTINSEVESNIKKRIIEAEKAKVIIHSEVRKFIKWKENLSVIPIIVDLREKAESIKDRELEKALNRLGEVSDREKHILETMASSIINTFLHSASQNIKEVDSKEGILSAYVLNKLFDLDSLEIKLDGSFFYDK